MYVAISFKDDICRNNKGFLSVPAHMLFGISMGYYLSRSYKYASSTYDANKYYKKSLIVPMILHGTFNFILLSNHPLLIIVFIPYLIYLWSVSIKRLKIYQLESNESEYEKIYD